MKAGAKALVGMISERLVQDQYPESRRVKALWLLEKLAGIPSSSIYLNPEVDIDEQSLEDAIQRLNHHEPIQYVLGEAAFYGRTFQVNRNVLIPRPETEVLVDEVKAFIHTITTPSVLDIGTGSGCIALTLGLERPGSNIAGTDISEDAILTATHNARLLQVPCIFLRHDILAEPLPFTRQDVMVSNPPYVMERERASMAPNVLEFEPHLALFVPDQHPLQFHNALAEQGHAVLRTGGMLITEINEQLGRETAALFTHHRYRNVRIIPDLTGRDRFVSGIRP